MVKTGAVLITRPAFGLVEVIVAITLVGIGVASVTAGSAFATNALRIAENREGAALLAESIIDSIGAASAPAGGARDDQRFSARWQLDAGVMTVVVTTHGEVAADSLVFLTTLMPRLVGLPCDTVEC